MSKSQKSSKLLVTYGKNGTRPLPAIPEGEYVRSYTTLDAEVSFLLLTVPPAVVSSEIGLMELWKTYDDMAKAMGLFQKDVGK
jgi:hypothetical protein